VYIPLWTVSIPTVRFEVGDLSIDTDTALAILDSMVKELNLAGAAVGGGFDNTNELHVLNYNQSKKRTIGTSGQ